MPSHLEFARSFQTGLSNGAPPIGAQAGDPGEVARRFDVYRNNVAYGLRNALSRQFPAIERLLGADCFAGVAQAFIKEHPPRSPILTDWGDAFPRFLTGLETLSSLPYLGDVAQIEWARSRAYHAADAEPIAPDRLTRLRATDRLVLHGSVQILSLETPAGRIWASQQPGGPSPPAPEEWYPDSVLVARRGLDSVIVEVIAAPLARFLQQVLAQRSLESACTRAGPGFDLTDALVLMIRNALIIAINEGREK